MNDALLSTKKYCCKRMKEQVEHRCEQHPSPFDCPDNIIYHNPKKNIYGLIIHDGGPSFLEIKYCPFCGQDITKSNSPTYGDIVCEIN